ncbi:unnamed protein product, partial [Coregonus sp. 'balchen']
MEFEGKRKMKELCALRKDIIKEFLAEFLGIFVLILFGCGSVAQTVLSKGALGEPLTIHIGFTLGVMMAVYVAGGVSGAHVNPAVSLAMVVLGKLPIKKFPVYVAAQFLGAFAGSCAVYGLYYDALMEHTGGVMQVTGVNATANIWASYPAKHISVLGGFVDQNIGAPKGMEPLCIGLIIMAIGVSMGLNCGYPINPARDLGPRLFTAVAGWGMEVFSAGGCWWWIPVAGPMVGGVVGAAIYYLEAQLGSHSPAGQPGSHTGRAERQAGQGGILIGVHYSAGQQGLMRKLMIE